MTRAIPRAGLSFLMVCALANTAWATPIGPVYPPDGGVTLSGSGVYANAGGRTNTYSNLQEDLFSELYWGAALGAGLNGIATPLAFASVVGDVATFEGETLLETSFPTGGPSGNYVVVPLQVTITLLTGASWISAGSVGLSPALGVIAVIPGTSFSANIQFLADVGAGWQALNTVQQPQGRNDMTRSSFGGGFYSVPKSDVPDAGGTLGLLSLAVGALPRP